MYTATTDVKEYFFPSKELKKNGEPKLMRVVVRKLLLNDPKSVFEPKNYRITMVLRKSGTRFAIQGEYTPVKPKWNQLVLDSRSAPAPEWKRAEVSKTLPDLLQWLEKRLPNAAQEMDHMMTDEPSNKKAA